MQTLAVADRSLSDSEIKAILKQLCNNPARGWIENGTIVAVHEEYCAPQITDESQILQKIEQAKEKYIASNYKPEIDPDLQAMKLEAMPFNVRYRISNEYTMTTKVIIHVNGLKYYKQIDVLNRTDTIRPPLGHTFMYDHFNLEWNANRVTVWDGNRYTRYSNSTKYATISESSRVNNDPTNIQSALTAGFIHWGSGNFSYDNLIDSAEISGMESEIDSQMKVNLKITFSYGNEYCFTLAADKNYATESCTISLPNNTTHTWQYYDYKLFGNSWIPSEIAMEKYDGKWSSPRLVSSDIWRFTLIDTSIPDEKAMTVDMAEDALIEHYVPNRQKALMYLKSSQTEEGDGIDSEELLAIRLAASETTSTQNCATLAMKYIAPKMGVTVNDSQLSSIISSSDSTTSLYHLGQFANSLGLYTQAVNTDIETLKTLSHYKIILHIPGNNHFVVVGNIDDDYIRLIDLAKNKFYYRTKLNQFDFDWTEGTALIISSQPLALPDTTQVLDLAQQQAIRGAACETGFYSCSNLLQPEEIFYCISSCEGTYDYFYERWGCICDTSGSCSGQILPRLIYSMCIDDLLNYPNCTITGNWTTLTMRACM